MASLPKRVAGTWGYLGSFFAVSSLSPGVGRKHSVIPYFFQLIVSEERDNRMFTFASWSVVKMLN